MVANKTHIDHMNGNYAQEHLSITRRTYRQWEG
jgi:hypothetical protein